MESVGGTRLAIYLKEFKIIFPDGTLNLKEEVVSLFHFRYIFFNIQRA